MRRGFSKVFNNTRHTDALVSAWVPMGQVPMGSDQANLFILEV